MSSPGRPKSESRARSANVGLFGRLLPYPITSFTVFLVWLLLNGTLAPAHLALATVLAVLLPLASAPFLGERTRVRAPLVACKLLVIVVWDIVVSNIVVARLVLGPVERIRPGFVRLPLDVEHPYAVSLLASIITMTPGTVSTEVSEIRGEILVHALDVPDPDQLVRDIKTRYEAPLKEIFG
jgi:multicomponent K+:H+ antiporter subunit E